MICPDCEYRFYRRYDEIPIPQNIDEEKTPILKATDYPTVVMTLDGWYCIMCRKVIEVQSSASKVNEK